jgi:hypothetical protein
MTRPELGVTKRYITWKSPLNVRVTPDSGKENPLCFQSDAFFYHTGICMRPFMASGGTEPKILTASAGSSHSTFAMSRRMNRSDYRRFVKRRPEPIAMTMVTKQPDRTPGWS